MSFLMTEKERTGECNREKGAKICRNWYRLSCLFLLVSLVSSFFVIDDLLFSWTNPCSGQEWPLLPEPYTARGRFLAHASERMLIF